MGVVRSRNPEEREESAMASSQRTPPAPPEAHTSVQGGKTAGWVPELRRIGAPDLRGSCPQSPVTPSGSRIAATQDLIAVTPSAAIGVAGVVAHPGSCAVGRARPESHSGTPPVAPSPSRRSSAGVRGER